MATNKLLPSRRPTIASENLRCALKRQGGNYRLHRGKLLGPKSAPASGPHYDRRRARANAAAARIQVAGGDVTHAELNPSGELVVSRLVGGTNHVRKYTKATPAKTAPVARMKAKAKTKAKASAKRKALAKRAAKAETAPKAKPKPPSRPKPSARPRMIQGGLFG